MAVIRIRTAIPVIWRSNSTLAFGLQGFGEESMHRLGPAIFGSRQDLTYDAAVTFGLTDETPDLTYRFQIEYEF